MAAIVINGADGAPFQRQRSPTVAAIQKFHPKTAHGKLKAVMIPTSPSGFHYSIMKWSGLSDGITSP